MNNELDATLGVPDDELTERFRKVILLENEMKKLRGNPIAGYDEENDVAYIEYVDGRREYV